MSAGRVPLQRDVHFPANYDQATDQPSPCADQAAPSVPEMERDLRRYYALLQRELATVRLLPAEVELLIELGRSLCWDVAALPAGWLDLLDVARVTGLAGRFGVDVTALRARLARLSPAQSLALIDAIERYWASSADDHAERLRLVGLA